MDIQGQPTPQTTPQAQPIQPPQRSRRGIYIILAILLFCAMLLALFFFWNNKPNLTQQTVTPTITPAPSLFLTLESPNDKTVVENSMLVVKGKTLPNIAVAFVTETNENSVESDQTGNFEGTITLNDGINSLVVTAYTEDGTEESKSMNIVYDSQPGK